MSVRVIVGLGNPGPRYDKTRHNAGFCVLDALAEAEGVSWREESRYRAHTASVILRGNPVLLAKPQTFMNESGYTVGELCRFLKLRPPEICVVYDEYQVPVGGLKVCASGGPGGHNGISSIVGRIGGDFVRYRIGIGPEEKPSQVLSDFVLGPFNEKERASFEASLAHYLDGLRLLVQEGPLRAMNTLNQRSKPPSTTT
jgi:PTH1 family peptidyl-tRNA hydrolase